MKTLKENWGKIVTAITVVVILVAWATGQLEIADVLERLGVIAGDGQ